jgi:hypothetical protein
VIVDKDGRSTPRYTTIYDAALTLYGDNPKDVPIPTLCHQAHMGPVAVCRLCVVQIYGQKRGKRAAERKLLPACQHQVKEGMEVFTMNAAGEDGERVRKAAGVLTELLAGDHLRPAPASAPPAQEAFNELKVMTERLGVLDAQVPRRPHGRGARADGARPGRRPRRDGRAVPAVAAPAAGRVVAGVRRRPRRVHPVRPLLARLRRGEGEPGHRPHRQGPDRRNRFRP